MTHSFPTRRSSDLRAVVGHEHRIADEDNVADRIGDACRRMARDVEHGDREVADRKTFAIRPEPAEVRTVAAKLGAGVRSEEHTSELQSLMRISYAVFCLKKKKQIHNNNSETSTNRQISNTNTKT